jgi:hypothetical protein
MPGRFGRPGARVLLVLDVACVGTSFCGEAAPVGV